MITRTIALAVLFVCLGVGQDNSGHHTFYAGVNLTVCWILGAIATGTLIGYCGEG